MSETCESLPSQLLPLISPKLSFSNSDDDSDEDGAPQGDANEEDAQDPEEAR